MAPVLARSKKLKTVRKVKSRNADTALPEPKSMQRIAREHEEALKRRREILQALPLDARSLLSGVALESGALPDVDLVLNEFLVENGEEWEDEPDQLEPDISHEGGEYTDALRVSVEQAVLAGNRSYSSLKGGSTRRERLRAMYVQWDVQMPVLVHEYLLWKHGHHLNNEGLNNSGGVETGRSEQSDEGRDCHEFRVTVIRTYARESGFCVFQAKEEPANVALLKCGLLGCSPTQPSVAFDLPTLELYHRIRRRHPRFSIQAMIKVLCDLHDVMYHSCYRDQFSIAFDAYLDILRRVEKQVKAALGRDTKDWQVKNACAACNYNLIDEEPIRPSRLLAMDGNNSARRLQSAAEVDDRPFDSDYFMPREQVDKFKNEVPRRSKHSEDDMTVDQNDADDESDAADSPLVKCDHFKNNQNDSEKTALDIYETTGIFPAACRHGLIEKVCEMIHSGELAKYPLAIIDHEIDVHGHDLGVGYDTACGLEATVDQSSLVGGKARAYRLILAVNAFHGYAHNRLCQVENHPLYLPGFGLEDLETLERVFSASNQWDEDKYQELSKFLLNNYRQALAIIKKYDCEVKDLMSRLKIQECDFEKWLEAERHFLRNLKNEPGERVLACAYVEALNTKKLADQNWQKVSETFRQTPFHEATNYNKIARTTQQLETARRTALQELTVAIRAAGDLEEKLQLSESWTEEHPDYVATLSYIRTREFHRAVNKLQQLVIQRLFEMSKANMSGTCYRLRRSIAKAIKTRSKAIRTAMDKYNKLAPYMDPPAPTLQWKQIVDYGFLSEFELLKHAYSHQDISEEPWAIPSNREVAVKYFKIVGAWTEIKRVNLETRRLRTSALDENAHIEHTVSNLMTLDPLLGHEVRIYQKQRQRVNAVHLLRLDIIENLPGFSGIRGRGVWRGAEQHTHANTGHGITDEDELQRLHDEVQETSELENDDEHNQQLGRLMDLVGGLSLETSTSTESRGSVPENMMYSWQL